MNIEEMTQEELVALSQELSQKLLNYQADLNKEFGQYGLAVKINYSIVPTGYEKAE